MQKSQLPAELRGGARRRQEEAKARAQACARDDDLAGVVRHARLARLFNSDRKFHQKSADSDAYTIAFKS